jgi:hypothetical protein
MRKLTVLLAAFVTIAVSCKKASNDPNPGPPEEPGIEKPGIEAPPEAESNALPMKVVMTNEAGQSETYTITYLPNSKKIDHITRSNGAVEIYHYTGDMIDKRVYGTDGSNYTKFEYQNNALVRETRYQASQPVSKSEFTYPSGNKMQVVEFKYKNDKWEQAGDLINFEFDKKGNLTKGESGKIKVGVSYDDKNVPFLNVAGWSSIHFTGGIPLGDNTGYEDVVARRNNPTKTTATEAGVPLLDLAFTYEFNDTQNPKFPTKITGKENGRTKFTLVISYSIQPEEPGGGQETKEDDKLPLKLIMNSDGAPSETTTITYQADSKKLDKIQSSNGNMETYHYDGDRIVKIEYGTHGDYKGFEYDATTQRLASITQYHSGKAGGQVRFTYTSNTALSLEDYKYENDAWKTSGELINLELDANGNVIKAKSGDVEINISFDTKKSPFFNVTGWAETQFLGGIPMGDNMGAEDVIGRKSNPTKTLAKQGNTTLLDMAFTYEFNDNSNPKFPTKITGTGRPFTLTIVYN